MQTALKKWGNSTGAIIPAHILSQAGLTTGDKIEITIEGSEIHIKAAKVELTLEALLAASPKETVVMTDEDKQWLDAKPVGKESI